MSSPNKKTIKIDDLFEKAGAVIKRIFVNRFTVYKTVGVLVVVVFLSSMGFWAWNHFHGGEGEARAMFVATGGTITEADGYRIHTFTSSDTFTVTGGGGGVDVFVWGAGGAGGTVGGWSYGAAGGAGGAAKGRMYINSGTYSVIVGGGGGVNNYDASGICSVGGGGCASNNNADNRYTGGGGGYSGVFLSSASQTNAIIIAGGGGGGGSSRAGTGNAGGGGGGTSGQVGYSPYDGKAAYGGNPGTGSSAGANASSDSANGGGGQGALRGGVTLTNSYGAGGGGGYFGGSAGGYSESNTMGGGGGGSGYLHPVLISGGELTAASGTTPGDSGNTYRGTAGTAGIVAGAGSAGIVVIKYPLSSVGPVAYWSFDEGYASTTYDRIGTNNGTLQSNTQWVDGKYGKALSFSSAGSNYVSVPNSSLWNFGSQSFTVTAWFKSTDTTGQTYIVNNFNGSTGWGLFRNSTNIYWQYYSGGVIQNGNGTNSLRAGSTWLDGQWHQVVVTNSNGASRIYIDGQQKQSATQNSIDSSVAVLSIGGSWNGLIDEPKIYNRALDYKEVAALYSAGGSASGQGASVSVGKSFVNKYGDPGTVTDGLVGYWKFDETSAWGATVGAVKDSSGMNNNGTSTIATTTTDQAKFGRSAGFNGVNSSVIMSDAAVLDNTSQLSVEFWINPINIQAGRVIMGKWNGVSNSWLIRTTNALADELFIFVASTAADLGNNYFSTTNADLSNSAWQHIIVVFDGTEATANKVKVYKNGALVGTSYTGTIASALADAAAPFGLGGIQGTDFQGYLDDVKIYNRALSADEIMREYVSGPGPVGYWRFEEQTGTTAYDLSGNFNNGTLGNGSAEKMPVWESSGGVGGALRYNGTTQYVYLGDVNVLDNMRAITMEAWFNETALNGGAFIRKWYATTGQSYMIFASGDELAAYVKSGNADSTGGQTLSVTTTDANLSANTWYHAAAVWSGGSNAVIYVNGVGRTATVVDTGVTSIVDGTECLSFGARCVGGVPDTFFTGKIDEVKLYNYARSQRQIAFEYNGGKPVAYWGFDEGNASTTYDRIGTNTGTLQGNTEWTTNGKVGKALSFDGSYDYVLVPGTAATGVGATTTAFTLSTWAFLDATPPSYRCLWSKNWNTKPYYLLCANASRVLYTEVADGSTTYGYASAANLIPLAQWFHLEAVFDGTAYNVYLDNKKVYSATMAISASAMTANANALELGGGGTAGRSLYEWDGKLDEMKYYNYARTEEEIRQDYNAGGGGKSATLAIGTDNNDGKEPKVSSNGLVGYWKFDEASWGTTVGAIKDSSGMGNNGTSSSATVATSTADKAKFGRSAGFDGNSGKITVGNSSSLNVNNITVESWVYPKANLSMIIFDKSFTSYVSPYYQYMLKWAGSTDKKLHFYLSIGGAMNYWSSADNAIDSGTWSHVIVTYDGSDAKIYVNGSQISATKTGSSTGNIDTYATSLTIGEYNIISQEYFNGYLDDFKIYNRALSADEVTREYLTGPGPIGYWRFEEQTGTTAYDASGNFNNGTLTNGPNWNANGAVGGALRFDGSDDFVTITDVTLLRPNIVSTSIWIKPTTTLNSGSNNAGFVLKDDNNVLTNGEGFGLWFGNTGSYVYFGIADQTTTWRYARYSTSLNAGTWYNLAGTYNGSTLYLYLNGTMVGSYAYSTPILYDDSPFWIGKLNDGTDRYFSGIEDELKIYNYARTPRQVAYDYNGGKPVAQWKFDEGQGGTVYDASGNGNNGTIYPGTGGTNTSTSTMWSNGTSGKINSALSFDGTDDYVKVTDNSALDMSSTLTVEAWVNATSNSSEQRIVSKWGTINAYILSIQHASVNNYFQVGASGSPYANSPSKLPTNSWHHLVGSYDGAIVALYIDGALVDTSVASGNISDSSDNVTIGSGSTTYVSGLLDDVRIYNYARTAEEVRLDYNNGAGARF